MVGSGTGHFRAESPIAVPGLPVRSPRTLTRPLRPPTLSVATRSMVAGAPSPRGSVPRRLVAIPVKISTAGPQIRIPRTPASHRRNLADPMIWERSGRCSDRHASGNSRPTADTLLLIRYVINCPQARYPVPGQAADPDAEVAVGDRFPVQKACGESDLAGCRAPHFRARIPVVSFSLRSSIWSTARPLSALGRCSE